jgi:phosphoribosylglycinamide formyltransferase-1
VHWVSAGVDEGEIIAQAVVDISQGDTVETLSQKVLDLEHTLYPKAFEKALLAFKKTKPE